MALRTKYMVKKEFDEVARREWVPVVLAGEGRPTWMRGIPHEKVELVLASGTYIDPRVIEEYGMTFKGTAGGIDIYRYDQHDEPKGYSINKDHYILVLDEENDDALLVYGPYKDNEHWISQLPDLPDGIVVIESTEE